MMVAIYAHTSQTTLDIYVSRAEGKAAGVVDRVELPCVVLPLSGLDAARLGAVLRAVGEELFNLAEVADELEDPVLF